MIAWAVAVTNSYILNSLFTFAAETGRKLSLSNYLRFAATGLFGMGMETTVLLVAREIITETMRLKSPRSSPSALPCV